MVSLMCESAITTNCVCVFFPSILDIKFVGRTSRGHTGGRSHRRKVTQDFSSTFFLRCVPKTFLARRIEPFLSLVDREVEFCVCVCVFSSHSFWTSMDVPAGVTQEESNTGVSIHLLSAVLDLIFLARRIQPFLSLVDREVEFCVLTI